MEVSRVEAVLDRVSEHFEHFLMGNEHLPAVSGHVDLDQYEVVDDLLRDGNHPLRVVALTAHHPQKLHHDLPLHLARRPLVQLVPQVRLHKVEVVCAPQFEDAN